MLGEHLVAGDQLLGPDNDLQALEELCKTTANESQRTAARRAQNTSVTIRPGNATERDADQRTGRLRDFSDTGCGILCEKPLMVGDIYLLELDSKEIDVSDLFARCVRCRMVSEGNFEHGFLFFNRPAAQSSPRGSANDLL